MRERLLSIKYKNINMLINSIVFAKIFSAFNLLRYLTDKVIRILLEFEEGIPHV